MKTRKGESVMKRSCLVLLATLCMLVFSGCICAHAWTDATCTGPKVCSKCGETAGTPLGHSWLIATCTTAKTCERCSLAEGDALGHSWADADCVTSKTCSTCGKMEGTPLGHAWADATTDSPKRCSACDLTEGSRIVTDQRFTTASASPLLGTWTSEIVMTGKDMNLPELEEELVYTITLVFGSAGDLTVEVVPANIDYFHTIMIEATADSMYKTFSEKGMSKEAADAAVESYYGMGVADYCTTIVTMMDLENLFADMNRTEVYYVRDGILYRGLSWSSTLEPSNYTLENGTLIMDEMHISEDEPLVFTKAAE